MATELEPGTIPYAIQEAFADLGGGVQRSLSIADWIHEHYPERWEGRPIRSHLRGCSVNNPIGIRYHSSFPRFLYKDGRGEFEIYDPARHGLYDERGYRQGQAPTLLDANDEIQEELADAIESSNQFAYEAHLRDYLAKNLGILEKGLALWTGDMSGSVEYSLDGRRIDILAKDQAGVPVVIELKLSRGHEKTIGQALFYRGKLRKKLNVPRVRIIMVAGEITDELRIASEEVDGVDLFSYVLTMQVQKIQTAS